VGGGAAGRNIAVKVAALTKAAQRGVRYDGSHGGITENAWRSLATELDIMQLQPESRTSGGAFESAPVVSMASADQRATFIAKTYLHLLAAIVTFVVLEVVWFSTPFAMSLLATIASAGRMGMLLYFGAFVGVSMLADHWARSSASVGKQYAGLGLYTVLQSVIFVPLLAMAMVAGAGEDGDTSILPKAILITLTLFGGLTGVVFITRKDFSFMRGVLMFGGFAALGLIVVALLFGFELGIFFSYAMVALACGYILYDTSNVMLHYRTNQHVAASLALFAAVMLLFWYVLRILLSRRR
jgi:FtsH-binding integral membrane protein